MISLLDLEFLSNLRHCKASLRELVAHSLKVCLVGVAEARGASYRRCLMVDPLPHDAIRLSGSYRGANFKGKSASECLSQQSEKFNSFFAVRKIGCAGCP